ncbi:hypothetical protein H0O00_01435 [Candidatus Micrarchaeota archaeon]|nr:hypothetical protein [Candidatus Micrarchaeota archaeon]
MEDPKLNHLSKPNGIQPEKREPSKKNWFSRHPLVGRLVIVGGLALAGISIYNQSPKESAAKPVPTEKSGASAAPKSETRKASGTPNAELQLKAAFKRMVFRNVEYYLQKEEKVRKYQEREADFQAEIADLSDGELIKLLNEERASMEELGEEVGNNLEYPELISAFWDEVYPSEEISKEKKELASDIREDALEGFEMQTAILATMLERGVETEAGTVFEYTGNCIEAGAIMAGIPAIVRAPKIIPCKDWERLKPEWYESLR